MNLADIESSKAGSSWAGKGRQDIEQHRCNSKPPQEDWGVPNFEPNTTDYKMHTTLLSFAAVL